MLDQLRAADLYPDVVAPVLEALGGEVELSCDAGRVAYTLDGPDPRLTGGALSAEAAVVDCGARVALGDAAREVVVRARLMDGAEWSALVEARYALPP